MPDTGMSSHDVFGGKWGWAVYNLPMMRPTLLAGIIISITCSPGATTGNDIWNILKQHLQILMMFDVHVPQCVLISETKGEGMTLVAKNNPVATATSIWNKLFTLTVEHWRAQ